MVFGEDKKSNMTNREYQIFKFGQERVKEKETYDHVGVKIILCKWKKKSQKGGKL